MKDRWGQGPPPGADAVEELIHLSRCVGEDESLVQPGGGNSSVKLRMPDRWDPAAAEEILVVKGSGTDFRTIRREGFTHLSLRRLALLRAKEAMTDEDMMAFMGSCMVEPHRDPLPSVETPLHGILPARVILHTHDVATMSLTNLREEAGRTLVAEIFGGEIVYVPFAPPGFELARVVSRIAGDVPEEAIGLALAHHGLVVWGETAGECYERLLRVIGRAEKTLAERRRGRAVWGPAAAPIPSREERERNAEVVLPVIRGFLSREERVVLHWEDREEILARLAGTAWEDLVARGMATPEHLLRAGRQPLPVQLGPGADAAGVETGVRRQLVAHAKAYGEYHDRHAAAGEPPLADWAKVILIPGLGVVAAFKDKNSARLAATCYRATMEAIEGAETLGGFQFLSEEEVFRFEHWPLERRKVEESIVKERATLDLARHVVLVIGGGSGIGEAAAWRFAEEGAHVVVGDLDEAEARRVADAVAARFAGRAIAVAVDVREEASVARSVRSAVLEYGGLDCLFYTAGLAPRFAPLEDLTREDLTAQLEVHTVGAILAIREASRVMRRQALGGSIVCSVSKAALAPGAQAAAYGASKAALLHALRVAAVELGKDGIRVNAINADQVETPLFLRFAEARAKAQGRTLEEQLERYRDRNVLGVSLIPARACAELAVLLASGRFRYTTGDILTIDGGLPEAFPR